MKKLFNLIYSGKCFTNIVLIKLLQNVEGIECNLKIPKDYMNFRERGNKNG